MTTARALLLGALALVHLTLTSTMASSNLRPGSTSTSGFIVMAGRADSGLRVGQTLMREVQGTPGASLALGVTLSVRSDARREFGHGHPSWQYLLERNG